MATLTPKQRQYLKGLAHALKPLLQIGKEGVTDAMLRSVATAFNNRELLKIKVLDAAPDDPDESGKMIADSVAGVELVQVIGKTLVFYRRHPEFPEIKLPAKAPKENG